MLAVLAVAVIIGVAISASRSGGHHAAAGSTRPATPAAAASPTTKAKPHRCRLHTTFNYLVRDTGPGIQPSAQEIGNVDYTDCTPTLTDFQAEAPDGTGDCETIALASANPGYNVDAVPARPLRHVIESAGPGC